MAAGAAIQMESVIPLLLPQGLEKIIWLWKGVAGDDSVVNGHVDNFAVSAGCHPP